ncbi:MAG: HEAT repeat domain-containing protein [Thermodesulfobacteriota bacterium]
MNDLDNFTAKDMIEQMALLDDIAEKQRKEVVPELMRLLAEKKCEQATHEMIYHTLFSLMEDDAALIKAGIRHPSYRVQLLSIRRCRKSRLTSARDDLIEILRASSDNEVIGEIIMTLGSFHDPALIDTLCPYLFHPDPTVLSCTMTALTGIENEEIREILIDLINGDDNLASTDRECSLPTVLAVEHLARMEDPRSRTFLESLRHHPNHHLQKAIARELDQGL